MGHTSADRGISGTDLVRCVSSLDKPSFRGLFTQALTLGGRARFFACRLRHHFLGECRQGLEAILELPRVSGIQPCTRTYLKQGLCHTRPDGWTVDKIRWLQSAEFTWWDTLWPAVVSTARTWSCVLSLDIPRTMRPFLQARTLFGGVRFIDWFP